MNPPWKAALASATAPCVGDLHEETSREEEGATVQPELGTRENAENADLHRNPDIWTQSL
jgi:hypothetical protein